LRGGERDVEGEIELAPGEICLTPGPMAQSHKQVVLEGTNELGLSGGGKVGAV
jgi:hypothetical protein